MFHLGLMATSNRHFQRVFNRVMVNFQNVQRREFPICIIKCAMYFSCHLVRGGSNDRMDAVPGSRKFWFFGKLKTKLTAICIDC